jgi:hypothetical protein
MTTLLIWRRVTTSRGWMGRWSGYWLSGRRCHGRAQVVGGGIGSRLSRIWRRVTTSMGLDGSWGRVARDEALTAVDGLWNR